MYQLNKGDDMVKVEFNLVCAKLPLTNEPLIKKAFSTWDDDNIVQCSHIASCLMEKDNLHILCFSAKIIDGGNND